MVPDPNFCQSGSGLGEKSLIRTKGPGSETLPYTPTLDVGNAGLWIRIHFMRIRIQQFF